MPDFEIIDRAEAGKIYDLPYWLDDEWKIVVHKGNLRIDRHLLLDWTREGSLEADQAVWIGELLGARRPKGLYCLVVEGDLIVSGSILNVNYDGGPALVVTGKTEAHTLLTGGAYLTFCGDAVFQDMIYADYNHGETVFFGSVSARVLINSDHSLDFRSNDAKLHIGIYINDMDLGEQGTDYIDFEEMPPQLSGVVPPYITCLGDIREALETGKEVLRG